MVNNVLPLNWQIYVKHRNDKHISKTSIKWCINAVQGLKIDFELSYTFKFISIVHTNTYKYMKMSNYIHSTKTRILKWAYVKTFIQHIIKKIICKVCNNNRFIKIMTKNMKVLDVMRLQIGAHLGELSYFFEQFYMHLLMLTYF